MAEATSPGAVFDLVLRRLMLTGFLALVEPGQIFQLLCGLLVAFGFSILQVWFIPYRTASNNLVATVVNVSLVLNFVSSLAVQVNAQYGSNINPTLLSAMLYVAALVMFPIMLLSLLLELCRPAALAPQLRAHLLVAATTRAAEGGGRLSPAVTTDPVLFTDLLLRVAPNSRSL